MTYAIGSRCLDCAFFGQTNRLRSFYISMDDKIIKCQSNKCLFPIAWRSKLIRRKPCLKTTINGFLPPPDSSPSTPNREPQTEINLDDIINVDDFVNEQAEHLYNAPSSLSKETINPSEMLDNNGNIKEVPIPQKQQTPLITKSVKVDVDSTKSPCIPPKARISRCLTNVNTNYLPKKGSKVKRKLKDHETVLIVEPQTGKAMRPLDFIKHCLAKN